MLFEAIIYRTMQILKRCMGQLFLDSDCMDDFLEDVFEEEVCILLEFPSRPLDPAKYNLGVHRKSFTCLVKIFSFVVVEISNP